MSFQGQQQVGDNNTVPNTNKVSSIFGGGGGGGAAKKQGTQTMFSDGRTANPDVQAGANWMDNYRKQGAVSPDVQAGADWMQNYMGGQNRPNNNSPALGQINTAPVPPVGVIPGDPGRSYPLAPAGAAGKTQGGIPSGVGAL